ncbi:hypothetical protein, partial [uncultured Acidaminococcus sp.]|uniref:hypothetical protein n=1 Tax=uncultured Acidaminococcus sp. TaxID=352152 RepID=UPI002666F021
VVDELELTPTFDKEPFFMRIRRMISNKSVTLNSSMGLTPFLGQDLTAYRIDNTLMVIFEVNIFSGRNFYRF